MTGIKDERTAVVLFNLGGPDDRESVRPFLFNLFYDPSIIRVPNPFRWFLAQLISRSRAPIAQAIYDHLGGGSPILENTRRQADALQRELADIGTVRVFIAMRYWHPMAPQTASDVKAFNPTRVVLLPLYPQWSTTTTASSWRVWANARAKVDLAAPEHRICCYPWEAGFVQAMARMVRTAVEQAPDGVPVRVLFSAHGLPKTVVDGGDPYAWQCERTVKAVVAGMEMRDLDYVLCYQSRVGPLEWIGPATEDEVKRAGADKRALILVPIAFVSEHSETLVELDEEYRELAEEVRVPYFFRVPTVSVEPEFIAGLARAVHRALDRGTVLAADAGGRICPREMRGCAFGGAR